MRITCISDAGVATTKQLAFRKMITVSLVVSHGSYWRETRRAVLQVCITPLRHLTPSLISLLIQMATQTLVPLE